MQLYLSTASLCEKYDVTDDFFLRRKKSGEFIKNIHYIQRGKTVRWSVTAVDAWWRDEPEEDGMVDDILNRVLAS